MLMNYRYPEVLSQGRREVVDARAVELDRAAIGCCRPRGDVHQRRLPWPVSPRRA